MKAEDTDCYIDVWKDADFGGERRRIHGPAEFPTLNSEAGDWGDCIGSLRVGPHAFVMAFSGRYFKNRMVTFGPNDEVADLCHLKFDDEIDSFKVIDSLKIFDEVLGRDLARTEEGAATQQQQQPSKAKPKNRHKGRRR
jgi:hypothetical protein